MSFELTPKIWGTNQEIYRSDISSVNVLHIVKGGTCSRHVHKTKHNIFHIISGKLEIRTKTGNLVIERDHSFTILAGMEHQFHAIEDTIAVEVMFVSYDPEDIERFEIGKIEDGS